MYAISIKVGLELGPSVGPSGDSELLGPSDGASVGSELSGENECSSQ